MADNEVHTCETCLWDCGGAYYPPKCSWCKHAQNAVALPNTAMVDDLGRHMCMDVGPILDNWQPGGPQNRRRRPNVLKPLQIRFIHLIHMLPHYDQWATGGTVFECACVLRSEREVLCFARPAIVPPGPEFTPTWVDPTDSLRKRGFSCVLGMMSMERLWPKKTAPFVQIDGAVWVSIGSASARRIPRPISKEEALLTKINEQLLRMSLGDDPQEGWGGKSLRQLQEQAEACGTEHIVVFLEGEDGGA